MRRHPPWAFAGAGAVFVVPRVGDADAQHEVIASAQSGFVVPHVGDPPPCSDAASVRAFAGAGAVFFVGKGRSEAGMWLEYVAYHGQACPSRAFALPRRTRQFAGVPKTQSICRGFARVGLLALRACSGMRFRLTPFVFKRASAQAGCVFATGSPHERDGVVSMRVSKACFGDAVRTPSWRAVPVGFSAGFPCKRVAFRRGSPAHRFRPAFPAGFVRKQAA